MERIGLPLRGREGLLRREGTNILLCLGQGGKAAEDHGDAGDALEEAEAPAGEALLRAQGPEFLHIPLRKLEELAAPQGFHDPDGEAAFPQKLHLGLGVLKGPVQPVELDLPELHVLATAVQKTGDGLWAAVGGETQVADATGLLLPEQEVQKTVLGV